MRTAFSGQIQDREFDDDERIIFDRVVSAITAIIVLDARAKHGPLLPYQAELLFVGFRLARCRSRGASAFRSLPAPSALMTEPDIDAIMHAFARAGLDVPLSTAGFLKCLTAIQPTQHRQKRTRGRAAKPHAAKAADFVMIAIEIATGCRLDLPVSDHNARPRCLEPVVGEVLALLGIVANPKAAIHAALAMRDQCRASGRRRLFPERGTDAAARRINMNAAIGPVGTGYYAA
ncbi:MAG: hypothetical protein WBE90_25415 [Xanthobacteraceae bacterium]